MSDSNRLEREIEEILGKIEQLPSAPPRRTRPVNRTLLRIGAAISERQRAIARGLARFSVSQVMLTSFLVILTALFFRRAAPVLMAWVLYAGIVLFVTTFAFMVFGGRSGNGSVSGPQRWRGRPIEPTATPSIRLRLRNWWTTRSRR